MKYTDIPTSITYILAPDLLSNFTNITMALEFHNNVDEISN